MKQLFKLCFVLTLLLTSAFSTEVFAQKFGHVHVSNLLEAMPEVKAADVQMTSYQAEIGGQHQILLDAFQKRYTDYIQLANSGSLSKVEMAQKEAELQKEQQTIMQSEQGAQQKILEKRQELLQPILLKVDEAIKALGKEQGYTFIFDSSIPNVMLYSIESDDLLTTLKSRLGF